MAATTATAAASAPGVHIEKVNGMSLLTRPILSAKYLYFSISIFLSLSTDEMYLDEVTFLCVRKLEREWSLYSKRKCLLCDWIKLQPNK